MTSRERVLAAYDHQPFDRTPVWCGMSDAFCLKARRELGLSEEGLLERFHDDFRTVRARYAGPQVTFSDPDVHTRTVFGIERKGIGWGHGISIPLRDVGLEEVERYEWPDPAWMEVSHLREEIGCWEGQYAVMGGEWSPFWHDVIDLLGMEEMYILMYEDPDVVHRVFTKVVDFYYAVNQQTFEEAADLMDIFFFGNDFGSQNGALISPSMFRTFIQPHLKRLIDQAHGFGLKVQMHSCGSVQELMPCFLEAGLDGLHALQPDCRDMDIRALKETFGDRLVLNGGIDSHHALICGTPESVREETLRVLGIMVPGGGYIAGASHDSILEETPLENVLAMFDAVREFHGID
ncbi:uroporphyrinogen decarboxylase family protein [Pontiella sulfatireligans]|uniref:Uroporphyrinogen decarboxylase (URO-D) domain-containing protein n=1 Tax=Pontiella sulfatireligans TaxID=2750658 RepID=A0A6C2UF68_9BACT|nr:uroporphyrinogen decarboxylase family protein [Pontiella sulfatireligans]VGO18862.1 hypothetical protein SCARR_00915 [Pontiella sulfatireligans]